MTNQRWYNWFN